MFSDLCPPPSRQPYSFSRGDNRESRSNSSSPLSHAFVLTRSSRIKEPLARRLFLSRAHQRSPREPCLPSSETNYPRGRRATTSGVADGALDGGGIAAGDPTAGRPQQPRPRRGEISGSAAASRGGAFLGAYEVATAEERPRMGKELSKGSGTHQSRCSSPAVVVASAQEVAVARTSRSRGQHRCYHGHKPAGDVVRACGVSLDADVVPPSLEYEDTELVANSCFARVAVVVRLDRQHRDDNPMETMPG